jgi:uroporphyrin-3 C-methyltransferase
MNSDTPKEGVVIDVTPEQETPQSDSPAASETDSAAPESAAPAKHGGGGGRGLGIAALLLALIALGITAAAAWFGYQQWQTLESELANARSQGGSAASEARALGQRLDNVSGEQQALGGQLGQLQGRVTELDDSLRGVQEQFTQQQQLLSSERTQLDERETQLRALVADLHERVGRSGNQWLLAEAEYLLKLADYRLRLASDPTTARTALALADERLHATGDPGWAGVREQIARDLTALDTLELPDVTGMWSRLGALIGQVPNLKLADDPRTLTETKAQFEVTPAPTEERTWRTLLADLWAGIKNAVRIRRNDEPVAAMLPPEQEYFLYENLRLRLEQARLALVQGRGDIYRESLGESRDWLNRHFATDAVAKGMDAALEELQNSPATTDLPDLSDSLRALQARRELLKALPPPLPETVPEQPQSDAEAPTA